MTGIIDRIVQRIKDEIDWPVNRQIAEDERQHQQNMENMDRWLENFFQYRHRWNNNGR
jgi:hypothetical protein